MTASLYLHRLLHPCFALALMTGVATSPAWTQIRKSDPRIVEARIWESAIVQVSDAVLRELHDLFFDIAVTRGSSLLQDHSELKLLVETVESELKKRNIHFVGIQPQGEDETSDETIYSIGDGVTAPVILSSAEPDYTDQARADGIEGTVVLEAVITKNGSVEEIKVVESLDPGLDERAVAAINQWRFRPAFREGKPVNSRAKVDIHFSLH